MIGDFVYIAVTVRFEGIIDDCLIKILPVSLRDCIFDNFMVFLRCIIEG